MRPAYGKRMLLFLLALCLAVLVFSFARRSVDRSMEIEREYPRKNLSLSVEKGEDGIIRIDGEGMLYGSDLKALFKEADIHSRDVTDIIVGDGITEIGYGAFADDDYLKTLKIGKSVVRIVPGAIRECESMEYVHLPSGLRRVGWDCLYECNKCRIVTDGSAEDLPQMASVRKKARIMAEVDSYEALLAACPEGAEPPAALRQWWP